MCPLNDDGLCGVYGHRLMICRMHGVPNALVRPDGRRIQFAGCFRAQELTQEADDVFVLDRTPLYTDLVRLEMEFLGSKPAPIATRGPDPGRDDPGRTSHAHRPNQRSRK